MTLSALIRKRGAGNVANDNPAKAANDGQGKAGSLARLAPLAFASPTSPEHVPIPDPAAESRRLRVLALLAEQPEVRYALTVDELADPQAVTLTLAIRGVGTCELRIPREKYDPFLLLELIERRGATLH